jgi:hypothetical protein
MVCLPDAGLTVLHDRGADGAVGARIMRTFLTANEGEGRNIAEGCHDLLLFVRACVCVAKTVF